MNEALKDLIIINSLRAIHSKTVNAKFYRDANASLVEDALQLLNTERLIRKHEQLWLDKYGASNIPKDISVKRYAELMGISTSTVYRHIKSGDIVATKYNNRWHIHTEIVAIQYAA